MKFTTPKISTMTTIATKIFVSFFLTWAAYDQNLFRRRREQYNQVGGIENTLEESDLQEKKQIQRQARDVIPSWERGRRAPTKQRVNYYSTKPRDPRFSNQRKIRRMFNNI